MCFAVYVHEDIELPLVCLTDFIGIVLVTEGPGGLVAVFLEFVKFTAEAAEGADDTAIFEGVGGELLAEDGMEEEARKVGCRELEADFGELVSVIMTEEFEEVVLLDVGLMARFWSSHHSW